MPSCVDFVTQVILDSILFYFEFQLNYHFGFRPFLVGLLLLMGVTSSLDCESVRGLIYEPIYRGSLYYQIHIVGKPIPPPKKIVLLKQICEALIFLHSKKMLHCSISSHAVHLVSTSQAKLGCFETLTEINPLNPNTSRYIYLYYSI